MYILLTLIMNILYVVYIGPEYLESRRSTENITIRSSAQCTLGVWHITTASQDQAESNITYTRQDEVLSKIRLLSIVFPPN